jgi:hypothetical protein
MLASLGHDPLLTVVCLLIMNTLATQFGKLFLFLPGTGVNVTVVVTVTVTWSR